MIYALEGRRAINDNHTENSKRRETLPMRGYLNYLYALREFENIHLLSGLDILDSQILALEAVLNETQE